MSSNFEKFNEYYKLKTIYDTQLDKEKSRILKNQSLSWKEKRAEFKKLKTRCIKCKRPVGNFFNVKMDRETGMRHLKASCGDLVEPCELWIDYSVPETTLYTNNMTNFEKEILSLKNDVINAKNKLLFGYITSEYAVEEFDRLKEMINDTTAFLEYFMERYANIDNNSSKNEIIASLKMDIYNTYIPNIKTAIDNFNRNNDEQFSKDAVDIYVNILQPKLKELRELLYRKSFVEYNQNDNTYHLVQKKYEIEDLEFTEDIIVNEKRTANVVVQAEEDNTESALSEGENDNLKTKYGVNMSKKRLVVDENEYRISDGKVIWDDIDYERTWNGLSNNHKEALMEDREWMIETMDALVDARRNKKSRTFIRPKNINIPPIKNNDEGYDFGNQTYNKIFNEMPIFQKNTILTLYSDNNGVRDYSLMENAMDDIVANKLGFKKY